MSVTYNEMKQQYQALQQTYDYMLSKREEIISFVQSHSISSIVFTGCGSSYCLSESAAFSAALRTGLPALSFAGGDLMLHADQYRSMVDQALVVTPSRSGSTSEVVEALARLQAANPVAVLSISCVTDSPLSRLAGLALELPWAFDHSVCQTRTVTNLYTANLLLTAFIAKDELLVADIQKAISSGEAYMARVEEEIRNTTDFSWSNAVVLADGELKGLAAEGAIALTEIAKVQAHAYHLLDVRHGPMVTIGPDTLVIAAISGSGTAHQNRLLEDLKGRGAKVIAFADHREAIAEGAADAAIIAEDRLDPAAQGIPFIFIPQLAALVSAERQGIDPDQPDGLVAWVKL